jgi:hypothetical protein
MSARTAELWAALGLWLLAWTWGSGARAQAPADHELAPGEELVEAPDPTRLDVARLPPEAIPLSRDLYAQGWFLEAQAGVLTFAGDAQLVSTAGPRFAIAGGYELFRWLSAVLLVDGSLHRTDNHGVPHPSAYTLIGGAAGVRFTLPFGARSALWAGGLVGVNWSSGDLLRALGFKDAFKLGINYGGELGFDWHMRSRHHSLGILGGARMYPSLARNDFTLGGYGSLYLRYVF